MSIPMNRVHVSDTRLCAVFRRTASMRLIDRLATEYHDSCGDAADYRMAIILESDGRILVNGEAHAVMSLIGAIADHGESWLVAVYCPNP